MCSRFRLFSHRLATKKTICSHVNLRVIINTTSFSFEEGFFSLIMPPEPRNMSKLEMNHLGELQKTIHSIDPELRTVCDPKIHTSLRAETMWIRDELREGHNELVCVRRTRLKELLLKEVTAQEATMRRQGYAYIPTQP